jgi:hypothetical protein
MPQGPKCNLFAVSTICGRMIHLCLFHNENNSLASAYGKYVCMGTNHLRDTDLPSYSASILIS